MLTDVSRTIAWGDFPGWLAATATLAAVAAAVWAGFWAKGLFEIESDREERTIQDQKRESQQRIRAQATKVAVWWSDVHGVQEFWAGNFSALPVFDVTAVGGVLSEQRVYEDASEPVRRWPVLAPLPSGQLAGAYTASTDALLTRYGPGGRLSGSIRFTDSAGLMWFRDGRGDLRFEGRRTPPGLDHKRGLTDSAN